MRESPMGEREAIIMDVLRAVRSFGDSHDRMSTGMKLGMDMNITDIAALRLLIMRAESGAQVTPADIARHLRISTASTTKLLDRLVGSGHVLRGPHPVDRRARVVTLTDFAKSEFFRLFGVRLRAMRGAVADFTDDELAAATRVITAISEALDEQESDAQSPSRSIPDGRTLSV